MKKVTMKDFCWVGKPQQWKKTYKELSLIVEGKLCLPEGPLILAVSDEDFTLSLQTTIAPEGGLCGICLYHTEASYTAVGRSTKSLQIESSVRSYKTITQVPLLSTEKTIQWLLERKGSHVRMGYTHSSDEKIEWVTRTTIPSMEGSVSFGVFFSNTTNTPFEAGVYSIRYMKSELQEALPLVKHPLI